MINELNQKQIKFDVFLKGETIDLCVPSKDAWVIEQWYIWFNDQKVTRYLTQGVFPNTREKQEAFYQSLIEKDERIALLIKPKSKDYFVGIASLSYIDHRQRSCDFAMVIGKQTSSPDSIFYAMEAKCRMTEHAFEKVGVERINSGQAIELIRWQRWQILFGYHVEGIRRKSFREGNNTSDSITSSCLLTDYLRLKELRNGSLWPGKARLFELMKMLPEESTIDRLQAWLLRERERNWDQIVTYEEVH